ncbi:MAG: Rha family transcriptional regulator [Prevotellaceae bacterium]|jgi:phage regulator Rha-like protein|nr:Rha family transcriptional regulator [Prevotellaceae bacterium]
MRINQNKQISLVQETDRMTSLQIAEVTGKMHKDVLEAVRKMELAWKKVTGRKFPLSEYTDSTGRKLPMYELAKEECLYIATKFNDEARAKLVIRWEQLEAERQQPKTLSTLDILELTIKGMRENQQELQEVKREVLELKAKTATRPEYFTIVGYGTLHHIHVDLKQAASLGRKATEICKARGIETDRIPDPRFGEVKMYPMEILHEVFNY